MYAARYSADIDRDFQELASSAGWALPTYASPEACRAGFIDDLVAAGRSRAAAERLWGDEYVALQAADGTWYAARYGLSAYLSTSVRDAVESARREGDRFPPDMGLWVFRVREAWDDEEELRSRVLPAGRPHRVAR